MSNKDKLNEFADYCLKAFFNEEFPDGAVNIENNTPLPESASTDMKSKNDKSVKVSKQN